LAVKFNYVFKRTNFNKVVWHITTANSGYPAEDLEVIASYPGSFCLTNVWEERPW